MRKNFMSILRTNLNDRTLKNIKTIFLSLFLVSFTITAVSCKDTRKETNVMIIGDSWGFLMCAFNSFSKVMKDLKYANDDVGCLETTKPGTTAREWSNEEGLKKITKALASYPKANYIYLSLGGNDFFEVWYKSISDQEKHNKFSEIQGYIAKIITHIKELRPQAKIVMSSYDYSNFQYLMQTQLASTYVKLYQRMGEPSGAEMHMANTELERYKQALTSSFSNVHYVNVFGLMQHLIGVPDSGIAPGELPAPQQAPNYEIGGNIFLWGPRQSYIGVEYTRYYDPYHLNNASFYQVVKKILEVKPL